MNIQRRFFRYAVRDPYAIKLLMGKTKQRKFFGKTIAGFIIKLFSNFQPFPMFENLQQNNQVVQKKYKSFIGEKATIFYLQVHPQMCSVR